MLQRPLLHRYGGLTVTACVLIIGAIFLSPWLGEGSKILLNAPPRAWLCVIELGVFPAAIGYASWSYVIHALGVAKGTIFLYFLPPMTFLLAFFLEGSWPDLYTILGGAIVMIGVALAHKKKRPSLKA
ncbi:DMT family transporter [Aristophania vespae]|uniref:DMT family transporter n=1 Tax=Aristophania vespae TaxID=2697033 RepID=UPI001F351539|nr:DMT family transporter [Aristophania vespae]